MVEVFEISPYFDIIVNRNLIITIVTYLTGFETSFLSDKIFKSDDDSPEGKKKRDEAWKHIKAVRKLFRMFFTLPGALLSPKLMDLKKSDEEFHGSDLKRSARLYQDVAIPQDRSYTIDDHCGKVLVENRPNGPTSSLRESLTIPAQDDHDEEPADDEDNGSSSTLEVDTETELDNLYPAVKPFKAKELVKAIQDLDKTLAHRFESAVWCYLQPALNRIFSKMVAISPKTPNLTNINEHELQYCFSIGTIGPMLELLNLGLEEGVAYISDFDNCYNEAGHHGTLEYLNNPRYSLKSKEGEQDVEMSPGIVIKTLKKEVAVEELTKPRLFAHEESQTLTENIEASEEIRSIFKRNVVHNLVSSTRLGIIGDYEHTLVYRISRGSKDTYTKAVTKIMEARNDADDHLSKRRKVDQDKAGTEKQKKWKIPVEAIMCKDRFMVTNTTPEMNLNSTNSMEITLILGALLLKEFKFAKYRKGIPHDDFDNLAKKIGFNDIYEERRCENSAMGHVSSTPLPSPESDYLYTATVEKESSSDLESEEDLGMDHEGNDIPVEKLSPSNAVIDIDVLQQFDHLTRGKHKNLSKVAELFLVPVDKFEQTVEISNADDRLVLEELKKKDPNCQIVLKVYKPAQWVKTDRKTMYKSRSKKIKRVKLFYKNVIHSEIKANSVIRDWNQDCIKENESEFCLNSPKLVTFGSLFQRDDDCATGSREIGAFVATEYISGLKWLDTKEDYLDFMQELVNLHDACIAHTDLHNGNVFKREDGKIVILDFNRSVYSETADSKKDPINHEMFGDMERLEDMCFERVGVRLR